MNLFDIIVFAICISSSLMGLHKGLLRLSLGLTCFILSLISADLLFPLVEVVVIEHISNMVVVNVVSVVAAFLISMLFFVL